MDGVDALRRLRVLLNEESDKYNYFSYNNNSVLNIPINKDNRRDLIVINPINLSGEIYGTYEILLSMAKYETTLNQDIKK